MTAPDVHCEVQHPMVRVGDDVQAAADFYIQKLGFRHGFSWGDPPSTVGVLLGQVEVFLVKGDPGANEIYFVIGDTDELFAFQTAQGVNVTQPPTDQPWGFCDFRVRDPWGNQLVFGRRLREGPPLVIQRVDVSVRLEKRLAAVLEDLAAHKKMTVSSCLEETLLHTFERVGDGVASPHSRRTLDHIQELKKKHGLDYDAHASYRFVE